MVPDPAGQLHLLHELVEQLETPGKWNRLHNSPTGRYYDPPWQAAQRPPRKRHQQQFYSHPIQWVPADVLSDSQNAAGKYKKQVQQGVHFGANWL